MELHIEKLKAIRKRKKITAEELAKTIGITRVTFGAWETGRRTPSEHKIRMLAKTLNVPVNEISDLPTDKAISNINLAPLGLSIISLLSADKEKNLSRQATMVSGITGMIKELSDARLVIGTMLSSLPSIFYIKGSDLKYITASEEFFKNLSLNKNCEIAGKTDYDFFPQNEAKINSEMDKEVLATGKSILDIEGYIPGNRKSKWGIISKIPILDNESKIEGVLGCFVDITERKKTEEELHENQIKLQMQNEKLNIHQIELEMQNKELRQAHIELEALRNRYFDLYDLAPVGFFTLDETGMILGTNLSASSMFGVDRDKLLKQPFTCFIHSEDKDIFYFKCKELLETNTRQAWGMRMIRPDGSSFQAHLKTTQFKNGECMIALSDITDSKKTEQAAI